MSKKTYLSIGDYVWYSQDHHSRLARVESISLTVNEYDKYGEDVDEVTQDDNFVADVTILNPVDSNDAEKWGRKNQIRPLTEYEIFRYVGENK